MFNGQVIFRYRHFKVLLSPLRSETDYLGRWVNAGRKDHKEHTSLDPVPASLRHQVLFILDSGSDKLKTICQCWEYTLSSDPTASDR
jgi:hypothetical protein